MSWIGRTEKEKSVSQTENGEESTVTNRLAHEPRTHLEDYLAYYIAHEKPGYAVLVTGDWGIGKTYQVTKALPATHAHYISLFGLNATEEIEAQVFAKMFPKMASLKTLAEKLGAVNVGVPGYGSLGINGLTSVLTNAFIKTEVDNAKPLIFDDLERCSIENSKILGIINRYVEHHKCRVIVIAHDSKIVDEFKETKEKIFGQTLMVEPDFEAAFEEFNTFFAKKHAKDLLGDLKTEVLSIFIESKARSLRILRHVVEDVRRMMATLEDRHRENRMAMVEIIRLLSALAIEYRSYALSESDLKDRSDKVRGYLLRSVSNKEIQNSPPQFVKSKSKYASVDLSSTILNDLILIEMLVEGRFIPAHIRDSINASVYFLEKDAAPPWQIVINFDKLDDSDVERALQKMDEQFIKREVTESGEFLHIVALRMMMASKSITNDSAKRVAEDSKAYLDDLLKEGRLPARTAGWRWYEYFDNSYAGVQYWVGDNYKKEFQEVFDYLIIARNKALENTFPALIPPLLDAVRTDGQRFFEKVCYTHNGAIEYEDIAILSHIPVVDFVDAWIESPKTGWYWIGSALRERSKAADRYPAPKLEADWFPIVVREMVDRAERETGLARLRIVRAAELVGLPLSSDREPEAEREHLRSEECSQGA